VRVCGRTVAGSACIMRLCCDTMARPASRRGVPWPRTDINVKERCWRRASTPPVCCLF